MTKLDQKMAEIIHQKKIGLMTHVVVGFPDLQTTKRIVIEMAAAGVDVIELQIPFSDPLADGPTIMAANQVAVDQGVTTQDALKLMSELSALVDIPLLFMGYYNSIFRYGVEKFCKAAAKAGAAGMIIPDLPYDEENQEGLLDAQQKYGLASIRVLSPTSSQVRIKKNCQVTSGFVYCTAVAGTTGQRDDVQQQTQAFLKQMRKMTELPLAVGFGISKPAHIQALYGVADLTVVGSAVIKQVQDQGIDEALSLVQNLVHATK